MQHTRLQESLLFEQRMSSIENGISEIDGNPAVESKQITEKQFSNQEHSFLMDQAYVQEMQDGLLEMLDNFKNGKHHGFGMLTVSIDICYFLYILWIILQKCCNFNQKIRIFPTFTKNIKQLSLLMQWAGQNVSL